MKILVYSHSSYIDAWNPLLIGFQKYMPNAKITFCIDREINIDSKLIEKILIYDDSIPYTERLKSLMDQLNDDDPFIFMHEDMFLYDYPRLDLIEKYFEYVKEGLAKSIKLIPVGENFYQSNFEKTLFYTELSKFSIQPTVTDRKSILHFLSSLENLNIWEFEAQIQNEEGCFVTAFGDEKKIGIFHYETKIFPYVAAAIIKGKWNISEYPEILTNILKECNIDEKIRGTR